MALQFLFKKKPEILAKQIGEPSIVCYFDLSSTIRRTIQYISMKIKPPNNKSNTLMKELSPAPSLETDIWIRYGSRLNSHPLENNTKMRKIAANIPAIPIGIIFLFIKLLFYLIGTILPLINLYLPEGKLLIWLKYVNRGCPWSLSEEVFSFSAPGSSLSPATSSPWCEYW